MRSPLFRVAYWVLSVFFALTALPLIALPGRAPLMGWIRLYTRLIVFCLRSLAGIRIEVRGSENLPDEPAVIAAKHQSWGDGIIMFADRGNLAFVTGDHLERLPLLGFILRKMGAIIVDNCGGAHARAKLVSDRIKAEADDNRHILIYPEGHLSVAGQKHRYRKGVYHLATGLNRPCVPVATNLGVFWPQQKWTLRPGTAIVEFLPPLPPALGKEAFMQSLEHAIETRSNALVAQGLAAIGESLPAGMTETGGDRQPVA